MAKRLAKIAAALMVAAASFGTLAVGTASPAGADTASDETAFVNAINQLRLSKGLRPLGVDPRLTVVARNWSANMASQNRLYHNPNVANQAPSDWTKLGENVGYGGGVATIHDAFVKSPAHYANLVDPGFNAMGLGVVMAGNTMWVTEVFEFSPSAPPPSAQAAPSNPTQGYWMVARDGGVFSFGDAKFYGSTGGLSLNQPIVGMASTKSGRGYWLVARDGGIFAFGDAGFHGSTGHLRLNQPIVSMAANPSGNGYWFVAADGGIFAFGDAGFYGSGGGQPLGSPVVSMTAAPNGAGYRLVTASGYVLAFGSAEFDGAINVPLNQPIVGMAGA